MSFIISRYLRFARRLESFDSPQLDALAERMGVLGRLNRKQRFFLSKRGYSAFSFPGGVGFGRAYWEHLDEAERMAIAAHEFSHIRSNDLLRRFLRMVLPPAAVTLGVMIPLVSWTNALPDSVFPVVLLFVAVATVALYTSTYALVALLNAPWRRRVEMKCDVVAAKYTDGEALIRALSLWEGAVSGKARRTVRHRFLSRNYPSLAERAEAIRETE